eukprot:546344-Amphidinium_carterae.1
MVSEEYNVTIILYMVAAPGDGRQEIGHTMTLNRTSQTTSLLTWRQKPVRNGLIAGEDLDVSSR